MKAYITEKLVNGCWSRLILFEIDTIGGIFSTQGGDLKCTREEDFEPLGGGQGDIL